jgi:hypothetical protein
MHDILFKFEAEILRLKWRTALNDLETAVSRRHTAHLRALADKAGFRPDQPRWPAGSGRISGRWSDTRCVGAADSNCSPTKWNNAVHWRERSGCTQSRWPGCNGLGSIEDGEEQRRVSMTPFDRLCANVRQVLLQEIRSAFMMFRRPRTNMIAMWLRLRED